MYCKFCGQNNSDDMKYCLSCGHLLDSSPVSPDSLGSFANRPGSRSTPMYQSPMNYSAPPRPIYRDISQVPPNSTFWAAFLLIIVSFISMFLPWIDMKVSAYYVSKKETIEYTDIFEHYDSSTIKDLRKVGYSNKKLDTMDLCAKLMKWVGMAAYGVLLLAVILGVVSNKHMFSMCVLAALLFAISAGADIVYCITAKEFVDDMLGNVSSYITLKVHPGLGIWLPLGCTVAASMLAKNDLNARRSSLAFSG